MLIIVMLLCCPNGFSRSQAPQPWYLTAHFSCSDPMDLGPAFAQGYGFRANLPLKVILVNQQVGYLDLGYGQFNSLLAKGTQGGVLESTQLTKDQAKSLRTILLNKSETVAVPFVGQSLVAVVLAYSLKASTGLAAGGFFSYVFSALQAESIKARVLAEVIAEGGIINRVMTAFKDKDQHEYALNAFEYQVNVGSEQRHYITTACVYPVKATITQITTLSTMNNKIFKLQENGTWRKWDITDSRFEDDPLIETGRDADFIYFTLNDPHDITNTQRISLHGGPWQILQNGAWLSLCSKTDPS
jgi:hypothetical protein